jgi:MFS family permease
MSATAGYLALLRRNADFRNLWYGQVVSLFGDWFNLIASATLVATLTGSGLAVGSLFAVRMLSLFLVSPIAGVAADRYDRRRLLIATDLVRAVVVLGFLLVRTPAQVYLLYTLTAVQLAMHGIFFPTRNAILPDLVEPSDLGAANAVTSATWSVMLAAGAAAGGLVAGSFGVYPAFVIDSATFLVSAWFIYKVDRGASAMDSIREGASLRSAFSEYLEGLSYLKRHSDVLAIALQKSALTLLVAGGFEVIQVAIAREVFVIGEGGGIGLGILYASLGLGSGLGPFLARAVTGDRDRPMRIAIVFCYVAMALGLAIAASLQSFAAVLAGTTLRAMGGGTLWVFSSQLLLHLVPGSVRGRVFSTEYALLTVSAAAGAAVSGWALDRAGIGPSDLLWIMSGVILVPALLWSICTLRADSRRPSRQIPHRQSLEP